MPKVSKMDELLYSVTKDEVRKMLDGFDDVTFKESDYARIYCAVRDGLEEKVFNIILEYIDWIPYEGGY